MQEPTKSLSFRLPNTLAKEVETRAKASGTTTGEWLREQVTAALANQVQPPTTGRDEQLTAIAESIARLEATFQAQASANNANALTQKYQEALHAARLSIDRCAKRNADVDTALMAACCLTEMLRERVEQVLGAVPDFFTRQSSGGYGSGTLEDEWDAEMPASLKDGMLDFIHAEFFRAMQAIDGEVNRLLDAADKE